MNTSVNPQSRNQTGERGGVSPPVVTLSGMALATGESGALASSESGATFSGELPAASAMPLTKRVPLGVSPPVLPQYTGGLTPPRSPEGLANTRPEHDSNAETQTWELRLYIAGQTPKSVTAFDNLKRLCEEHLPGHYKIEVIDLMQNPQLAAGDQIVAIPTLIRKLPEPLRRIVGDLSNTERTLVGLQLRPATPGK